MPPVAVPRFPALSAAALGIVALLAACTAGAEGGADRAEEPPADGSSGPPQPTPEEYEFYLAELAEGLRLDAPPEDVAFERYVSLDEWAFVLVECLTEHGVAAEVSPDGGISYGRIPQDQGLAQREAAFRCRARFPTDPRHEQPLDDDRLRLLFQHQLGTVECLEAEGYETTPPPSEDVFVDTYYDPDTLTWTPYANLEINDPDEWYRLNELCPQTPDPDVLYGTGTAD